MSNPIARDARRRARKEGFPTPEGYTDWASGRRRDGPKLKRNDPCPCGSGRKVKKCCGI